MSEHRCLQSSYAGFPRKNLPDVGRDGLTADGRGPFTHDCWVCGLTWIRREVGGFVVWTRA